LDAGGAGDPGAVDLRPLTARSVILSILLGTHPPRRPVRVLIRLGDLFGISEGTVRVALSRMVADGELRSADGWYELDTRLLTRQRRLDEGRSPELRVWRGGWEMAVIRTGVARGRRTEVLDGLTDLRLAMRRDGVWLRPANLARSWPAGVTAGCDRFDARPGEDPTVLAGQLWDLPGWARRGTDLLARFQTETTPSRRFALAAAMVRHLRTDPVLPARLLPPHWPGSALRRAYGAYEVELGRLLGRNPPENPTGTGVEGGRLPGRPSTEDQAGTGTGALGREASARHSAR
jgi:phenylacetic acid degradation operon negative regulatory protein